jgi:predicted alpha/beta-fold hydrolase
LPRLALRRERWELDDGDFVDLDWLADGPREHPPDRPLLVVLHGLEGSSRSHYAVGLLDRARAAGWSGVVLHFRSCSGEVNRLPRSYDSGFTDDLDGLVRRLAAERPARPLGLAGASLGGNVILKWLGERGDAVPGAVVGAAVISTPFDLEACARAMDRGLNRWLYTAHFLRTMRAKLRAKAALMGAAIDVAAGLRARTFAGFDRAVTAPLGAYADEVDYWRRASSGPYLARIRKPCLLIAAENDPFIPVSSLPRATVEASPWLEAAFVREGGHVGFVEGTRGRSSWAERRAMDFLCRRAAAAGA